MTYEDLVNEAKERFVDLPPGAFSKYGLAHDVGCEPNQAHTLIKEWQKEGRCKYICSKSDKGMSTRYYIMLD